MLLEDWQRDELKRDLMPLLNEHQLNPDRIADILNDYLGIKHKLRVEKNIKYTTKILLCTGAGNTVKGGADIWVNNFLEHVWPNLPYSKTWRLLIDSKRPADFDEKSLPKGFT